MLACHLHQEYVYLLSTPACAHNVRIFWYHEYCPHSPLLSSSSSQEHWLPLVAEHEKDVLKWTACVNGDRLVLCYLQDVKVGVSAVVRARAWMCEGMCIYAFMHVCVRLYVQRCGLYVRML